LDAKAASGRFFALMMDNQLGRSLRDLIELLDDLRARGVRFQSLTQGEPRYPLPRLEDMTALSAARAAAVG
jgi:DNA invertase Pin-like site-specific DNA recombinase